MQNTPLSGAWARELEPEFNLPYMQSLRTFLGQEKKLKKH